MLAVLLALVVFLLVVEPVLVALHEFGHAIVPLAQGRETAIFVGGQLGPTIVIGPLTLTIAPVGFLRPITEGATVTDLQSGRWTVLAGTLGGPLTSLLAAICAWLALRIAPNAIVWGLVLYAFVYAALQTLSTLVPLRGPAPSDGSEPFKTDGRIALELLLGRDPVLDGNGELAPDDLDRLD